jgi:dipeptidase E
MKLYLSSLGMGDRIGELIAFLGPGARVAIVENAVDYIPVEERRAYHRDVFDPAAWFRDQGLAAEALDLRAYFGGAGRLAAALADVRLVWATGGNAFLLRRAMAGSGLDAILGERLARGDLVYGGWSAGAVVACPTLRGIELMDDPAVIAPGYADAPLWEGLGLIDYWIVPHYRSDHPESPAAERVAGRFRKEGLPFRALRDGEVIVV